MKLFIDGKEEPFENEHKFEESKEYLIEYKFDNELINMTALFMDIKNLKEIDFSDIKAENISTMDKLFRNRINLEKVMLNNLKTYKVETMISMFQGCNKLKELNMVKFDTSNANSTNSMFKDCIA